MHDALEELSDLSESLQADTINLPTAHKLIVRVIDVLCSRKGCNVTGEKCTVAQKAVEAGSFRDIELQSGPLRDVIISWQQFYQAISDSFSARLLTDKEKSLVEDVTVLQPLKWPVYVPPEYGEVELKHVCARILVQYSVIMNENYQNFKDFRVDTVGLEFMKLQFLLCR